MPTLKTNRSVKVIDTMHSHVPKGMVGTIRKVLPDGYEVYFPNALLFDVFHKAPKTKPAIVFMRFSDVEYDTPSKSPRASKPGLNGATKK